VKRYKKYRRKKRISPTTTSTADDRGIYAATAVAAEAVALKFHQQREKRQNFRQNETHYEMIWKIWKKTVKRNGKYRRKAR
jgi:hypothetical protein